MSQRLFLIAAYTLLMFLSSCSRGKEDFKENLSKIEMTDQKILEDFFKILIKQNEFGYTLFGVKPVSIASYSLSDSGSVNNFSIHSMLLEEGWASWQKYAHLFPSKNFQLGRYETKINSANICNIYIVNKKSLKSTIESNREVFSFMEENLYGDVEKWLQTFLPSKKLSQAALGILLGYGRENSLKFDRRTEIAMFYLGHPNIFAADSKKMTEESKEICLLHGTPSESNELSILEPSKGFATIVEEFNTINAEAQTFELEGTVPGIASFGVLGFVCFDSTGDETQQLVQSYQETLQKIIKKYENRPFLETTLDQWTKG